jgi:transcriptional regulator
MYNISYFKAKEHKQIVDFMQCHPFAVLTGCINNKPVATHVPLLIKEREDKLFLQGHIMRKTDHHRAFENNPNILVIFTGPHTYVSASWYTHKQEASTWNYLTVHAKGTLTFQNKSFLLDVLKETTAHFEDNAASPSLFEHLPEEYVEKLSEAIIAFEIEISEIDHVFKLSQNKDEESYNSIIENLSKGEEDAKRVATLMKQNI